jgi:hypothetical protein
MFSFQAFQIFLFLIPGLLASIIMNALIVRKEQGQLNKITEALIFSIVIYITYFFLTGSVEIPISSDPDTLKISYQWKSLFYVMIISVGYGTLFGGLTFYDYILKTARWLKLTKKTSRDSVWYDVFSEKPGFVIVNFADGYRLIGYPEYFSDNQNERFLYLTRPAWVVTDKLKKSKYVDLDARGILITPDMKIETIEFLPIEEKPGFIKRLKDRVFKKTTSV